MKYKLCQKPTQGEVLHQTVELWVQSLLKPTKRLFKLIKAVVYQSIYHSKYNNWPCRVCCRSLLWHKPPRNLSITSQKPPRNLSITSQKPPRNLSITSQKPLRSLSITSQKPLSPSMLNSEALSLSEFRNISPQPEHHHSEAGLGSRSEVKKSR
ncbi:hypothetical protein DPEC_G00119480 [Dallia pectoralis]|uniref:Uncharacterized protein n=1 Tax=Dallia pectoralis TaxID=75939 RepID=A0ACC2GQ39_DALPE|nr:hypothetical protein DPEC_G00119480 [Dallia pectoralis]